MSHYILVEKDSKMMQKWWNWSIIFLLITISITCLISSYAVSALVTNFKDNCVPGAKLSFEPFPSITEALIDSKKHDAEFYSQKVDKLYHEFKTFYMSKELRKLDETSSVPKTQIYQFLNSGPSITRSTTERSSESLMATVSKNDSEFFRNYKISEEATSWGDSGTCSSYYFFPVIELTAAIVWIVLILISHRKGEHKSYKLIHKSWRLVVPAVVSFALLAICCVIYAAFLNSQLNSFCSEIKEHFTNHEIPCEFLLNRFSMQDSTIFEPATNFIMTKSVAYIRVFLWLVAGFVMLLRCILGADFEMQEVQYSTEQLGTAFHPQSDHPSKVKFIDDSIRRYSRERVYNPTTTTELQPLD